MTKHKVDSILAGRIDDLKKEIGSKDYQVIKAARMGISIDDLYPGHTAWYQQKMDQLFQLEEIEKQKIEAEEALNKKEDENESGDE
jgi:c-di-AMP phosphodiesterase-like protein